MAQPMLQFTVDKTASAASVAQATPHLLPCRINHDGPVDEADKFWQPKQIDGSSSVAYFRGRKLYGHAISVPETYRGVVAQRRDSPRELARQKGHPEEVIDVDVDAAEQDAQLQRSATGELAVLAEFDHFVVWDHQNGPSSDADVADDPYARGVHEWLALAEQLF